MDLLTINKDLKYSDKPFRKADLLVTGTPVFQTPLLHSRNTRNWKYICDLLDKSTGGLASRRLSVSLCVCVTSLLQTHWTLKFHRIIDDEEESYSMTQSESFSLLLGCCGPGPLTWRWQQNTIKTTEATEFPLCRFSQEIVCLKKTDLNRSLTLHYPEDENPELVSGCLLQRASKCVLFSI